MPLIHLYSKNFTFAENELKADCILLPIDLKQFEPVMPSGLSLLMKTGQNFSQKLKKSDPKIGDLEVIESKSLEEVNIKTVIPILVSNTLHTKEEIENCLTKYYELGLRHAATNELNSIVLPFLYFDIPLYQAEESFKFSMRLIQSFISDNPRAVISLLFENEVVNELYLREFAQELSNPMKVSHSRNTFFNDVSRSNSIMSLSIEANTPTNMHLNFFNEFKSLDSEPRKIEEKVLDVWQSYSKILLSRILQKDTKDLHFLKFVLGPSLYYSKCEFESGILSKLGWDSFKLQLQKSYFVRALYGAQIYSTYLKHKLIFTKEPEKFKSKKLKTLIEPIELENKKSQEEYSDGLESYKNYMESRLNGEVGLEIEKEFKAISNKKDSQITDLKDLSVKIQDFIKAWEESFIQPKMGLTQTSEVYEDLIRQIHDEISQIFKDAHSIKDPIKKLKSKIEDLEDAIKRIQIKIDGEKKTYQLDRKKIIRKYREFAEDWIEKDSHYSLLIDMIKPREGFPGLRTCDLIKIIIENNTRMQSFPDSVNTRNLFCILDTRKTDSIKHQYKSELKKIYLDPAYSEIQNFCIRVHTYVNRNYLKTDQSNPDIPENVLKDERLIASKFQTNAETAISILHTNSFDWKDLKDYLITLKTNSEAQQLLKMKLLDYINQAKLWTLPYDKETLESRKRQVTYLMSCLFHASHFFMDVGYIITDGAENKCLQGVDLVLSFIKRHSRLASLLADYVKDIQSNEIAFHKKKSDLPCLSTVTKHLTDDNEKNPFNTGIHFPDIQYEMPANIIFDNKPPKQISPKQTDSEVHITPAFRAL